ncbi:response regulator transcription factor [Rhodococcus sp. TAF43]|uniref:helix-turn-helix transcriptional regulator n=1 Tax=unclassified Rhodococcus (in: high G+C Gram-positive bacteria) TaxID=192944 RepID=UPI0015816688|nr:LuxR C-terminal-related transcriptional regulator [Rhodococcus sp. W8901]QKT13461.1 response regulator transcription factor [Rhodococcus sp. W8901]
MTDILRPSDEDAIRAELRYLRTSTTLPVLFGGLVAGPGVRLSGFVGTRGAMLRDLVIDTECGLGGRVIAEQRPGAVQDYANSRHITHDYDHEVASEGIESLLAAPVVVRGTTRAAVYGGLRANLPIGDVMAESVMRSARKLAHEIEIRDEVDRRVAMIENARTAPDAYRDPKISAGITESYLALRAIADRLDDDALGAEVRAVEGKLRGLTVGATEPARVTLSPREFEVLVHVALGCRNAEIGERLGLRLDTVKSYMRNIMTKLEVRSRHEAVVEARRQGLIP